MGVVSMDGQVEQIEFILSEYNFFRILQIATDASDDELRKSFKQVAKQIHPDRFQDPLIKSKAQEAFLKLNQAFNTLRDPLARKEYERRFGRSAPATTKVSEAAKPNGAEAVATKAPPPEAAPKIELKTSRRKTGELKTPKKSKTTDLSNKTATPKANGPKINISAPQSDMFREMYDRQKKMETLAEEHFQAALEFERKNQLEDAVREFQEAIRIHNKVGKYHSHLALVLDKKGWGGYAQAEYKVALHFDPLDEVALKKYRPTSQTPIKKQGIANKLLNIFRSNEKSTRIGDILVAQGHLSQDQLEKALKQQHDEKLLLGEILIRMNYIRPEHLAQALIAQSETAKPIS